VRFVPRYLAASWRARRSGGDWYRDNPFEREAQAAAEALADRGDGATLPPR
jgi:hypothetical protein